MANPIDYYGDITLHGGTLKDVAIEEVPTLPTGTITKGRIVIHGGSVKYFNGTGWTVLGSTDNIKTVQDALDALTTRVKAVEDNKVDKVSGKQLSTEDYTTAE